MVLKRATLIGVPFLHGRHARRASGLGSGCGKCKREVWSGQSGVNLARPVAVKMASMPRIPTESST